MGIFEGAQRRIYKLVQLTAAEGDDAEVRAYPNAGAGCASDESKRRLFTPDERRRGGGPTRENVLSDLEAAIRRYRAEDDFGLVERSVKPGVALAPPFQEQPAVSEIARWRYDQGSGVAGIKKEFRRPCTHRFVVDVEERMIAQ